MEIKTNSYINAVGALSNETLPKTQNNDKTNIKSANKPDTFTISAAGKQFVAEKTESNSKMGTAKIVSDLDSFRDAVKSMNKDLEVNWNASVDSYGTIAGAARVESILKQLQDPNASKNVNDMDKAADKYVQDKINSLIEKKKTIVASMTQEDRIREANEYKTAYEAYHSENGKDLIDKMSGNMKKAYEIYKNILDGNMTSLDDQEFLIMYNNTMYRGAKSEWVQKTDDLYPQSYGV